MRFCVYNRIISHDSCIAGAWRRDSLSVFVFHGMAMNNGGTITAVKSIILNNCLIPTVEDDTPNPFNTSVCSAINKVIRGNPYITGVTEIISVLIGDSNEPDSGSIGTLQGIIIDLNIVYLHLTLRFDLNSRASVSVGIDGIVVESDMIRVHNSKTAICTGCNTVVVCFNIVHSAAEKSVMT